MEQITPTDTCKTISGISEGYFAEQRSKFLSFALPVITSEEVKEKVDAFRKQHYSARHVCWAYVLGVGRTQFRVNDDGEPSSTAGKPILGVINSNELTDVLIVVVRYFGGVKLGASGLIAAYRTAAQEAIAHAEIIEKTVDEKITVTFAYPFLNGVMKVIKEDAPLIVSQQFDMDCVMTLRIRVSAAEKLREKLLKIESLRVVD
ncbi:MAG: YigZ family protein [Dysgonamonadaceae bacterium]|nr:YigZ family protein [Dysgonamonadaceae bacterium]